MLVNKSWGAVWSGCKWFWRCGGCFHFDEAWATAPGCILSLKLRRLSIPQTMDFMCLPAFGVVHFQRFPCGSSCTESVDPRLLGDKDFVSVSDWF